jgi:hypothetical protein
MTADLDLVVVWNGAFDGPDSAHNAARPKPTCTTVDLVANMGGRPQSRSTLRVLKALRDAYPLALTHSAIADALGLKRSKETLYSISQARWRLARDGVVECVGVEQRGAGLGGRHLLRFRYVPHSSDDAQGERLV